MRNEPPTYFLEDLRIRKLKKDDLPGLEWDGELIHLRNIFFQAYQQYENGDAVLWVAEFEPVGIIAQIFVQLNSRRSELADGDYRAYIFGFRVREQYRNFGVGTKLMDIVESDLHQRGYQSVTLNVGRNNPKAQRFYERRGYGIVAKEPGRWYYYDHTGTRIDVNEPGYRLEKILL